MLIVDLGIAIGPILGYIAQLRLIKQKKQIGSFSIDICAILIISNILRLYYWFITGYAFNLFIQSILVIIVQLMLLQQCIKIKYKQKSSMFQIQKFWRWQTFEQYLKFIFIFIITISIITLMFQILTFGMYGQIIGYTSMMIESTLGLPQLLINYKNKNVNGLSFIMILTWFLGDFFKTIYFLIQKQPFPFILCGSIQLTVDILIIIQIIIYSNILSDVQNINLKQYDPVINNQISTQQQS